MHRGWEWKKKFIRKEVDKLSEENICIKKEDIKMSKVFSWIWVVEEKNALKG